MLSYPMLLTLSYPSEKYSPDASMHPRDQMFLYREGNTSFPHHLLESVKHWQAADPPLISVHETICMNGKCGGDEHEGPGFNPCIYPSDICMPWCKKHKCTWLEKCTWDDYCAGCPECNTVVSCSPACYAMTDPTFEAGWKSETRTWDEVCNWGICHGCNFDDACGSVGCYPPPPTAPPPPAPPVTCAEMREDALNFEGATLAANNLGGMGPVTSDPAELRLSGVTLGSATMDFVITNLTRYYGVPTKKVAVNGMRGDYGQFGLAFGLTDFKLAFVEPGTNTPVTVPDSPSVKDKFAITIMDFDRGSPKVLPGGTGKKCAEFIKVAKPNYDAQYAVNSKYLKVEEDATAVTALAKITAAAADNPKEWLLSPTQIAKAFPFTSSKAEITITMGYVDEALSPEFCKLSSSGRWFQISGYSQAFPCTGATMADKEMEFKDRYTAKAATPWASKCEKWCHEINQGGGVVCENAECTGCDFCASKDE
jgi:hypothetical protein